MLELILGDALTDAEALADTDADILGEADTEALALALTEAEIEMLRQKQRETNELWPNLKYLP